MKLPFVMYVTENIHNKQWICFNTFGHVKFTLYNSFNDFCHLNQNNYFDNKSMVKRYKLYYLTVQVI